RSRDGRRGAARRGRPVQEGIAGGDRARERQRAGNPQATSGSGLKGPDCSPWWRAIVIPRYTHPEMGRIWSDQRRYETWLVVESAAAEAMAAAGIIPPEAARDIGERGAFDIARIEEIEQTNQHDVIAFT